MTTLTEITAFDLGKESGRLAFDGALIQGRPETPIVVDADSGNVESVEVVFETPMWLEHNGRVIFAGKELGAFMPMLRMAEKTHIGKATSFGLGRIRVERVA